MPPTFVENMLETMMMQMLQPAQNAANAVCFNCFKLKETCCKCMKTDKSKRRRRRKKKSCLKTIVCVSNIAKDRRDCQACSCDPCCSKISENYDESFCSRCGQKLPGFEPVDQPLNQPDQYRQQQVSCQQQLEHCQQVHNDREVVVDGPADQPLHESDQSHQQLESCQQVLEHCQEFNVMRGRVERQQPLSVRIKVCPCPNTKLIRNEEKRASHSASMPELSRTNPRLIEEGTRDNLDRPGYPKPYLEGNNYYAPHQPLPHIIRFNEVTPEWRMDTACIKRLAMKMSMAQLVEEVARRESFSQDLEQSEQNEIEGQASANGCWCPEKPPRSHQWFENEQLESAPGPGTQTPMPSSYVRSNVTRVHCRGYLRHSDEEGYHSSPEAPRHLNAWFDDEKEENTSGPLGHQAKISERSSYFIKNHTSCNQAIHASSGNEFPNSSITGESYSPWKNMAVGCCCCPCTNVHNCSSKNGHNAFGYHCQQEYTSGNSQFQPHRPFPGPHS